MSCVLTLRLNPAAQAHFEALRQSHFPPERNHIPAHLTLFHTLPDSALVRDVLGELCASEAKFPLRVTGVRSLGRGVAYQLASPDLLRLHAKLSQRFVEDLSRQDQQRFQPHIVVQNKVTPETARALLLRLEAEFAPWQVWAEGCDLWEYLGGPWRLAESYGFLRQDPDLQARAIV